MLTVLISVLVNDSAPSLGTHYRAGWRRGREMESVKSRMTEIQPTVFILHLFYFGLTLNPISPYPSFSSVAFFFLCTLSPPPHPSPFLLSFFPPI